MKKYRLIIITIILSIMLGLGYDLVKYNRKVINKNKNYDLDVIEMKNIKKSGDWYTTTSKKSYIVVKNSENYVNRIAFKYKTKNDFAWNINCINGNDHSIKLYYYSSSNIKNANKEVGYNAEKIRINFNGKNIKFKDIKNDSLIHINWNLVIFFILFITSTVIIIRYRKYFYNNLEKAFIFISIVCGLALLNSYPKTVYLSWDDQIHVSNMYYALNTETAPTSPAFSIIENTTRELYSIYSTKEEQKEFYNYLDKIDKKNSISQVNNFQDTYKRIVYLPFTFGYKIAKFVGLGFTNSLVFAKFVNMLVYIMLLYLAIKVSTWAKKIIFAIGLFESNMFLSTQFSYDPVITACLTLAFALFLRILEDNKINKRYLFGFIISVAVACMPKAVYCPILLLLLFIPNKKFDNKKQAILFKGLICITTLMIMMTFVLPMLLGSVGGDPRGGNTSASGQFKNIISNPIGYGRLILVFFIRNGYDLFLGKGIFVANCYLEGTIRGGLEILYIMNLIYVYYLAFTSTINKKIIDNKMKIVFSIMIIGIFLLISTALYISFTEVGASTINGVQNRYFIPLFLPFWLLFLKISNKTKDASDSILMFIIPLLTVMYCAFFITIGV